MPFLIFLIPPVSNLSQSPNLLTLTMSNITRRNFMKGAGLLSGGLATFGLGLSPQSLFAAGHRRDLPYYHPGAPLTSDLRHADGGALTLRGTVYGPDGKTPLPGATVEVWHCDPRGRFDFGTHFAYRGKTHTDAHGAYTFRTNFPGQHAENGRRKMSRIFVLVQQPGHQESFSELYFDRNQNPYVHSRHWQSGPLAELPTLPRLLDASGTKTVVYHHYLHRSTLLVPLTAREMAVRQVRLCPARAGEALLSVGPHRVGSIHARLLDRTGRQVHHQFFAGGQSVPLTLAVGHLPPGTYACLIHTGRMGSFTKTLSVA